MAKVILVDNLKDENIPDRIFQENLTDEEAEAKAKDYNKRHTDISWDWYAMAVPDNYKLNKGSKESV